MNNMNDIKEELLKLYISALEDATGYFLSDYCTSREEEEERLHSDEERIMYFRSLLEQI